MKRELVLKLALDEALEFFSGRRYKFYHLEDIGQGMVLKLEVPLNQSESFVVELHYESEAFLDEALAALRLGGWIEQEVRISAD